MFSSQRQDHHFPIYDDTGEYDVVAPASPWYNSTSLPHWKAFATHLVPSWRPFAANQLPTNNVFVSTEEPFSHNQLPKPKRAVTKDKAVGNLSTVLANRRITMMIIVMATFIAGLIGAAIYLSGAEPDRTTPAEQFIGTMRLDALEYSQETYGDLESPEYKQLEKDFCSKVMNTLTENYQRDDAQKCKVTGFSSGSVIVHYIVIIQQFSARGDASPKPPDTLAKEIMSCLLTEMRKRSGVFRRYLKDLDDTQLDVVASAKTTTKASATPSLATRTREIPTAAMRPTTESTEEAFPTMSSTEAPTAKTGTIENVERTTATTKHPTKAKPTESPTTTTSTASKTTLTSLPSIMKTTPVTSASSTTSTKTSNTEHTRRTVMPTTKAMSATTTVTLSMITKLTSTETIKDTTTTNVTPTKQRTEATTATESSTTTTTESNKETTTTANVLPATATTTSTTSSATTTTVSIKDITTTTVMPTTATTAIKKVCDSSQPCANGGRCVDKSTTESVCVCSTCGCLSSPPLTPTCDIDKSTICLNASSTTYYLVAFPYDCHKFINCSHEGAFVAVNTVGNNNVFKPENGQAVEPSQLACAVTKVPITCEANRCKNKGTCVDIQTGFQCNCPPGFIGDTCETETEKCRVNTCQNSGTCTDTATGVQCTCPNGYTGNTCETDVVLCSSITCLNGGACSDTSSGFSCSCKHMYTGTKCETEVTVCDATPCKNGGRCVVKSPTEYVCVCPTCGCLSSPPLTPTCDIDKSTICLDTSDATYNLVAFPYDCQKYVQCLQSGAFVTVKTVAKGKVYNSLNGQVTDSSQLTCAVLKAPEICDAKTCKNGATCVGTQTGFRCMCPFGFIGDKCETEAENCNGNTCQNGGTCTNMSTGIICTCASGYIGTRCETETEKCGTNSCQNGGTCSDSATGTFCSCPHGFTGTTCETEVIPCTSDTCLNGGTCGDTAIGFSCSCVSGYTGIKCETKMTVCDAKPCKNGGRCVVKSATEYVCVCPTCGCLSSPSLTPTCDIDKTTICNGVSAATYHLTAFPYDCHKFIQCTQSGEFAELKTSSNGNVYDPENGQEAFPSQLSCATTLVPDICDANTCKNGATCVDTQTGFRCMCPVGFIGDKCETAIEKCTAATCQNAGTCRSTTTGVHCDCPDHFTGTKCETEVIPCSSNTCLNGGTCIDSSIGFSCNCKHGYTGTTCETDIDECASKPCHREYSVSCVEKVNNYSCSCTSCSCSSVRSTRDCKIDATNICSKATGAHNGVFYLAHPHKCNRYIQCTGTRGFDLPCAPPLRFNPDYTSDTDNCINDVPQCVES